MSVTRYLENKSFHGSAAGALGAVGGTNLAPARQDDGAPVRCWHQKRPPPPALLERTLGTCTPQSRQQNPTPPSGRKRRVSVYPRAPRCTLVMHGSLHYRIADPPATQDTNKERRVSLQGESCRFNLRAVREQGSDRISAALAYAASAREERGCRSTRSFSWCFNALCKHIYINVFLGWINTVFLFKFNPGP